MTRDSVFFLLFSTGVKPFKCDVCDASFTTNGSLSRHMIIHVKSFKCSLCDESFRTGLLCKRHMKKEHGVQEYSKDDKTMFSWHFLVSVVIFTSSNFSVV